MAANSSRKRRISLFAIVGILVTIGLGQSLHRHFVYEVPWMPGAEKRIWSIEARIQFDARGDPVAVNLRRPADQLNFSVLDESGASPGFGLNFLDDAGQPTAQWTVREADGPQTLYYRAEVLQRDTPSDSLDIPPPPIRAASWEEPYRTAANAVMDRAIQLSAVCSSSLGSQRATRCGPAL